MSSCKYGIACYSEDWELYVTIQCHSNWTGHTEISVAFFYTINHFVDIRTWFAHNFASLVAHQNEVLVSKCE